MRLDIRRLTPENLSRAAAFYGAHGYLPLCGLEDRVTPLFNQAVAERSEQPPVPLADLLAEPDFEPEEYEWRQVTVAGVWLEPQVLVFNRTQMGRAGDNVLTALRSDAGAASGESIVLVNRGFVALGDDIPDAIDVETAVLGRVRVNQSRQRGGLTDTPGSDDAITEVRRIDIDRLAPQYQNGDAVEVAPVYLDLIETVPPVGASDPIPVPAPELGEGNHLSYAFQWFIFAICVVIGWALAVRRSVGTRRAATQ